VFQRTQAFPLGQRAPHSTFPTHHRLWDTTLFIKLQFTARAQSAHLR